MPGELRLVPVAASVWLTMLAVLSGLPGPPLAVGVVAVLAGFVGWWHRHWLVLAAAVAIAVALVVGGMREHTLRASVPARLGEGAAIAVLELQTTGDPERFTGSGPVAADLVRVPALTRTVSARGQEWRVRAPVTVLVTGSETRTWSTRPAGTTVRVTARLAPADAGTPSAAAVRIRGPSTVLAGPPPSWRWTERVRGGLRDAVAGLPAERRALVPALVVGDTSAMTDDLREQFRVSGLSHLTAVSGANLALMLAFVLTAARWTGVRGWWLRSIGLACVVAFVGICRTEPSVLRAAAMGLVVLAGLGLGGRSSSSGLAEHRRHAGFRPLATAVLVLLLADPWLSRSAGFALSVLATGGIVALARRWADTMARWSPGWLAEAVAVPLAAQLATQPVVSAISGQLSVVGIVANALAGPCVGPATVLGFAAAAASLVSPPVAGVLGWTAGWVTQLIIWVAATGAALPGAVLRIPVGPVMIGVLTVGCVLVACWMPRLLGRPWMAALAAALLVVSVIRAPAQPGWPPPDWLTVACDVGQGDAVVVDLGGRSAAVIDTGPQPALVDRCLDQLGITRIPLLVLTHFHADHVGGLAGVLAGREVGLVLVSPMALPPREAEQVRRLLDTEPTAVMRVARPGLTLDVGDLHWATIGPVGQPAAVDPAEVGDAESSAENDGSIVGVATVRTSGAPVRILFTGDVEPDAQLALLAGGAALAVDVLKVPHHGSSRQDQRFLAATGARIAITSSGEGNSYGHPAPSTVRRLEQLGMTVVGTDRHGGVAVWSRGDRLGVTVQR